MRYRITVSAVLLLMVCAVAGKAAAQTERHQPWLNIYGTLAQKAFRENVKNGGGLELGYAYDLSGNSPLMFAIGGMFGFNMYGHEQYTEPFNSRIGRVNVDVETSNNMLLMDLVARLGLKRGMLRPYVEGRTGFSYLYTESQVKDQYGDRPIASTKNFSDWTHNSAFGGGFVIPLYHNDGGFGGNDGSRSFTVLLDTKFLYWHGGKAEYLKKGGIIEDPESDALIYDVKDSVTDMTSLHLGVIVTF